MPNINPFIDDLLTVAAGTKFVAKDGAAPAGHHTIEQIITYLGGSFAALSHGHIIADTSGLQAALDAKAALAHSHIIADVTGLQAALDGKAASLGADDNYATDAEKVKLSNLSGTNTGDQTSIVGLTGTKAEFNTAVSDGDIQFVGDAPTAHTHDLDSLSDVIITTPSSGQVIKYNGTNWINGTDVSGGAGAAWVSASLTIPGGRGAFEVSAVVASVGVTTSSIILTKLAPALDTDENDPEMLSLDTLIAIPGTDQFTLLATFRELTSGIIKTHYQVAA